MYSSFSNVWDFAVRFFYVFHNGQGRSTAGKCAKMTNLRELPLSSTTRKLILPKASVSKGDRKYPVVSVVLSLKIAIPVIVVDCISSSNVFSPVRATNFTETEWKSASPSVILHEPMDSPGWMEVVSPILTDPSHSSLHICCAFKLIGIKARSPTKTQERNFSLVQASL